MFNISVFQSAGLPAVTNLAQTLRKLETATPSITAILKMDKFGHWVFGADQTEAESGSRWAVNPFSFVHGLVAWGDGEVLGEAMAPLTEPLPEVGPAPDGAKFGWQQQVGFSLKCISGEDEGLDARFASISIGGKRAVQTLGLAIATQVEKDSTKPVPVITLDKDHYVHKSYGKVYVPVLTIVDWLPMDGGASEQSKDVQKLDAPEAGGGEPRRRQRRTA
jgi:hypothetical protein